MNIEEYISSGTLELYAANALSEKEMAEVEEFARLQPAIKSELDQIQDTLERYVSLHNVTPPAYLKEKILESIPINNSTPEFSDPEVETGKIISFNPTTETLNKNVIWKWAVAASVGLLLLSNLASLYFYNNWKDSENRLQLAMLEQQQFASNLQQVNQKLSQNQRALLVLKNISTKRVELNGVENSPESRATVFWHQETSQVFIAVNNLPKPPAGKQYQLWALVDGKPIDAGMLEVKADALQPMKETSQAQTFAVTLEPTGGSQSPTLDQMFVIGNVKS